MDIDLVWKGIIVLIAGIVLHFSPDMFGVKLWEWFGIILVIFGLIVIVFGFLKKPS